MPIHKLYPASSAVSRRSFLRYAGVAASLPILTEAHFAWAAQNATAPSAQQPAGNGPAAGSKPRREIPANAILINANENPLGPCQAACEAIARMGPLGGRYDLNGETDHLTETFARQNGLKSDYIAVYAGSSEPLHFAVLAFTSPQRGFVTADPSYEAGMVAAMSSKARISKVPLTPDYAHDVKAMIAADPKAGLLYICNPNNPTGTLTPRADIEYALAHKPKGSILLVDEAYIHLSDAPSVLDLVAANEDLIVLRTFSKVYGMAGIRCGLALGRPDLLAKLRPYGMNAMPITGSAAANASLLQVDLVPARKKIIADTRNQTFAFLNQNGYKVIPSVSNCFMIQTDRPGKLVIEAMKQRNIYIGRTWPIWPNAVRISVGTPDEMTQFQTAFKEVMDAPPDATKMTAALGTDFRHIAYPYLS